MPYQRMVLHNYNITVSTAEDYDASLRITFNAYNKLNGPQPWHLIEESKRQWKICSIRQEPCKEIRTGTQGIISLQNSIKRR